MSTRYSPGCDDEMAHICDFCEIDDGRPTFYWKHKDFDLCPDCIENLTPPVYPKIEIKRLSIKEDLRNEVFKRDGHVCVRCGNSEKLTLDHIRPFSKGGATERDNLQTLCFSCNLKKRAQWKIPGNISQV